MNKRTRTMNGLAVVALMSLPIIGCAQVPVDDQGNELGSYSPVEPVAEQSTTYSTERPVGNEDIPLLVDTELQELVGPIALYPDDLLAVVLPASAYPLQIIEAERFLEALESDPSLQPDPEWDDSVVALLNYPEVVELLNDDIDWTWRLGEAVVAQQDDVVGAIETFRDRAYAAGNLQSDEYQNVTRDSGVIEISPASEEVIYVPYYEPERVVVYQPRPVYYYYPRAYPVYYYPYPSSYYFDRGFFWGVTTAFTIGWVSDSLHVHHHSYYGHPYYGHSYRDNWYYRRPSINVYNRTYIQNSRVTVNHYYGGDQWRPRHDRRDHIPATRPRTMSYNHQRGRHGVVEQQLVRTVESRQSRAVDTRTRRSEPRTVSTRNNRTQSVNAQTVNSRSSNTRRERPREPIQFRDRSNEQTVARRPGSLPSAKTREPAVRERAQPRTQRTVTRPQTQARNQQAQPQRQVQRRDTRLQPQVQRRESRPQPQVQRRESRPQPQVQRRESRPQPQVQRRESRPEPQVRRQQPAPQPKAEPRKPAREQRDVKRESRSKKSRSRER